MDINIIVVAHKTSQLSLSDDAGPHSRGTIEDIDVMKNVVTINDGSALQKINLETVVGIGLSPEELQKSTLLVRSNNATEMPNSSFQTRPSTLIQPYTWTTAKFEGIYPRFIHHWYSPLLAKYTESEISKIGAIVLLPVDKDKMNLHEDDPHANTPSIYFMVTASTQT